MNLMYLFYLNMLCRCKHNICITGVWFTSATADVSELAWVPVIFAMTLAYLGQPAFWDFHTQERVCDSHQQIPPQKNHKIQSGIPAQPAYQKEETEATVESRLPKLDDPRVEKLCRRCKQKNPLISFP